jgi:pimeloyl-ACP methyl ester carboxylesterase
MADGGPRGAEMHLRWQRWGTGPARVLALHCGLGQGRMWAKAATLLSDDCTLRAPDLPAHGRSPPFPPGRDVHDVATAALHPHLTQGLHLIGHSFGATLALRLALDAPGVVASLVLIEPVFFAAAPDGPKRRAHRLAEEEIMALHATGDLTATARAFNRLWGGGVAWDSFADHVQQGMARRMPFVMGTEASLWQDSAGMLAPGRLEALHCPVTLLRGADTVPIIAEVQRGLMARLPHATEIVVEGAAHMLVKSHPEAVAAAVRDQLTG